MTTRAINWLSLKTVSVTVLCLSVFLSALGVVYTKHVSRQLFITLQDLQKEGDNLTTEWGQLSLEQSTWASHGRVERIAREELKMVRPEMSEVVFLHEKQ